MKWFTAAITARNKNTVILFLLILTSAVSFPLWGKDRSPREKVLIWEVTKPAYPGRLYLAGSVHAARKDLYPLDSVYDQVWKKASCVYFEIADQNAGDLSKAFLKYGMYGKGRKLSDTLSWMDFQTICTFFMKYDSKYNPALLEKFRPWALYMQSAQIILRQHPQYKYEYGLERIFSFLLGEKKLYGLETAESQIRSISLVPDRESCQVLMESVKKNSKAQKDLLRMNQALQQGKITILEEMLLEVKAKFPSFYHNLFVQRNKDMAEKIYALLKKDQIVFILVGAGHFAGPGNILQELQSRKCRIRQLEKTGRKGLIMPEK